ncbi:hypothetical protein ACFYWP_23495 [Actinacidiphila glaucinigra]|uniref:hypothetical protein n=1 Tax=Actinacidiphila glaucinigra TaxID=235986 RepID=UPI0036BCB9C9
MEKPSIAFTGSSPSAGSSQSRARALGLPRQGQVVGGGAAPPVAEGQTEPHAHASHRN